MRREIDPQLFNYNKFPGPDFVLVDKGIHAQGIDFTLLINYRDGFNLEKFQQRFSDILLKYDYVLGDWSSDELRLRGFYQDHRTQLSDYKISRLDEYLKEYCNFGCAYFLLENPQPIAPKPEKSEGKPRRKRQHRRRPAPHKAEGSGSAKEPTKKSSKKQEAKFKTKSKPEAKKNSASKSKTRTKAKSKQANKSAKQTGNDQHFTIRKKG